MVKFLSPKTLKLRETVQKVIQQRKKLLLKTPVAARMEALLSLNQVAIQKRPQ